MAGFSAPLVRAGEQHDADGRGPRPVRRRSRALHAMAVLTLVLSVVAVAARATPAVSAPAALTLHVFDAAVPATTISNYQFLVNVDNTGQNIQRSPATGTGCSAQDAGYPGSCQWTSMGIHSVSPIFAQGDQSQITAALAAVASGPATARYLISVLADGYKLDGAHFTAAAGGQIDVPLHASGDTTVLPSATVQTAVFEDNASTNSAPDLPAEHGLAGFQGRLSDYLGQLITDVFGNPMCSTYVPGTTTVAITGGNCLSKCYVVDSGIDIGIVAPLNNGESWANGVDRGQCPTTPNGQTLYDQNATPTGPGIGLVPATAAIEGKLKIPNLGPNRYALAVIAPDGSDFTQTTTLEGDHDWDAWVMEGATGLDTEFVQAGEPFPGIIFGYVHPTCNQPHSLNNCDNRAPMAAGTGTIKGTIDAVKVYYPPKGGVSQSGLIFGGLQGARIDKPIPDGWLSLTDLNRGDASVWTGKAAADGTFTIPNVPAGDYSITWWDEAQTHILDLQNVTVTDGATVDLGVLPLNGWWTDISGYIYNDLNRNGVKDPGEPGIKDFTLTMRKRENSLMDRGGTSATTDANGFYQFKNAYPMTQWLVVEAYNDRYYTTGVTYQPDNAPPTTHLADRVDANGVASTDPTATFVGTGVDVSMLPIIGLSGTLDWGVHNYDPIHGVGTDPTAAGYNKVDPANGGIVGTVSYDVTRNELDPRYAAVEDWQPGIPGALVKLWAPVDCGINLGAPCDLDGLYEVNGDGSLKHGDLLNEYTTEEWQQPTGCTARDIDGNALVHGTDEQVLPTQADAPCLEGPLMGIQFENGFAAVTGNYGFTTGCLSSVDVNGVATPRPYVESTGQCSDNTDPTPLTAPLDYIVEPIIPDDVAGLAPAYKVTSEEDINIANGDQYIPSVPPPACAGALHTVDVATQGTDGYAANTGYIAGVTVPGSTPVDNPNFVGIGGSPYEGQVKPSCAQKLVSLNNGKSIVPTFNWFTPIELPGRFWGLAVDDLQFSANPKSLTFGEKQGISFAPVGIYDYTDDLKYTTESDYNGLFDVLMPSTTRISCPTPSGVCANVYRFVGNDPGTPGKLNLNYKPGYRTIAAEFEAWPGLIVPADLAPTQIGVNVQLPGGQIDQIACAVESNRPQLFTVTRPYVIRDANGAGRTITITGTGFGGTRGSGSIQLGATTIAPGSITTWNDSTIVFVVSSDQPLGPQQLTITASSGLATTDGLTFHVIGDATSTYHPTIREVGPTTAPRTTPVNVRYVPKSVATTLLATPPTADHAIQNAIDDARSTFNAANPNPDLIVVYPGLTDSNPRNNPRGAYFENLVVTKPISIQGVGPGGINPLTTATVQGSIVDGSAFAGDSPVATDWDARVAALLAANSIAGNTTINDGAVFTLYASNASTYATAGRQPVIDGLDIRGADQQGFPTNINAIGGGATGLPPTVVTQGGAVFANAYIQNLRITNNVVESNGGGYGNIRIGTAELTGDRSSHNTGVKILSNRIIHNAGTNLAGGIGLFYGSDDYEVANNDICGNFSAEYGGGVSVYGLSPNGSIHDNKIRFDQSYDEGGGVMIAGELPADPTVLSTGAGAQNVYNNMIQANLSNDDGGGIRFLQAGNFPMNVYNNMLVNNVSTHEGGGIAIDDAPNVRFFNNTVMKNVTTATAVTSNGLPAPAGLSTGTNSAPLQATLGTGASLFSNPVLFNNIFWDNRAGTYVGGKVAGIGAAGDTGAVNNWDLGLTDNTTLLAPTNSIVQQTTGSHPYTASATNRTTDPVVVTPYDIGLSFSVWRNNPKFIGSTLVLADLSAVKGDYHLKAITSPANNIGAASKAGIAAAPNDIDNQTRPQGGAYDAGADEFVAANTASASVSPAALTFGDVYQGSTSTQTLTLTNSGTAQLTGIVVAVSAPFTRPANAAGGTCATTLNAAASCTIVVSFSATTLGAAAGNVVITASVPVTNAPVPITANVVAAPTLPAIGLLDSFTRVNANNLGANWSQLTVLGAAATRVNNNQASDVLVAGTSLWNAAGNNVFAAKQGAAFTFANGTVNNAALILKASGGNPALPTNNISVLYNNGSVQVRTTINSGGTNTVRGTLTATFANTDTLSAVANTDGSVDVWKTTAGAVTTFVGHVVIPTTGAGSFPPATGGGRIGMIVPANGRVDNFSGGTVA